MQASRLLSLILALMILCSTVARADDPAASEKPPTDPQAALFRLLTGNTRFYENRSTHANQGAFARSQASAREYPWAVVLTCSDSRVPPEIVFDQGLGDMTVVRLWGSYIGDTTVGSIQHALEDHTPRLIVVLGHSRCGALKSAIEGKRETNGAAKLVAAVQPAVAAARKKKTGDLLDSACRQNVYRVSAELVKNPVIAQMVKSGKVRVVNAYYDIDTGHVTVLKNK